MQSSISKYRITKRVGGGSFGYIYLGVGANGENVAVKFGKRARCPQLLHEYKVYLEIRNAPGFAKVHYFGSLDSRNLMVMDLLGPSLEDQFNKCGRRFSLKTVIMIADEMLERVEIMHSRHLIHRDIKPANFVTEPHGAGNFVFCIDFGLSKR
jgi:serine/threonine protein kinase